VSALDATLTLATKLAMLVWLVYFLHLAGVV
jgi:hypothetical protein